MSTANHGICNRLLYLVKLHELLIFTFFLFAINFSASSTLEQAQPCAGRLVGNDSKRLICVCNATYCDSLGHVVLPPKGFLLSYTSDIGGRRMEKQVMPIQNVSSTDTKFWHDYNTVNITLHLGNKSTNIMGFGGSFTDAVGIHLLDMSEELSDRFIKSYFGPTSIGYTMTRIPMGGTDFSLREYTYDDNNGRVDALLLNFTLQEEDYKYKIPAIKKALSLEPRLQVMASPWSASPWMKDNQSYKRGFLKAKFYHTWANYFAKFIQSYESEGIPIWGVSVQNEPTVGYRPYFNYISMQWTPWSEQSFVEFLGPVLKGNGYGHVKIMIYDLYTLLTDLWVRIVLSSKVASSYVSGISIHWYSNKNLGYGPVKKLVNSNPDKFVISTEASVGFFSWEENVSLGSWERGENYIADIIQDLVLGVRGWIDWNLVLDEEGGPSYAKGFVDCAIIFSKSNQEFYKQPMFYALGHISAFFPPSSQVVRSTIQKSKTTTAEREEKQFLGFFYKKFLSVAAIRPDGGVVVAILNREDKNITVNLVDEGLLTADKPFKIKLSPHSMTTLLYNP